MAGTAIGGVATAKLMAAGAIGGIISHEFITAIAILAADSSISATNSSARVSWADEFMANFSP